MRSENLLSFAKEFLLFLLFFLSAFIVSSIVFISRKFGEVTAEQILFHLNLTLKDSSPALIKIFIVKTIIVPFIVSGLFYFWVSNFKCKAKIFSVLKTVLIYLQSRLYKIRYIFALFMFFSSLLYAYNKLHIDDYLSYIDENVEYSSFYETNYVSLNSSDKLFPAKKRNLIVIFAEGFEATFAMKGNPPLSIISKSNISTEFEENNNSTAPYIFGSNLIPKMYDLSKDNVSFSGSNNFGGLYQVGGTSWTMAALVAYSCGIPLRLAVSGNSLEGITSFLPNATCIGDILKKNEYNQSFIIGQNKSFSGLGAFLNSHSINRVMDHEFFLANSKLPSGYHVNWGFEDKKVFNFAKDELIDLSVKDKPFALYMMTLDTHVPYFVDNSTCKTGKSYERFKESFSCLDQQIFNFIRWVEKQKFYQDTTIVVLGDHLHEITTPYREKSSQGRIFNLVLNSNLKKESKYKKQFTHFDYFPTILEAIGADIKVGRLALGTSLWSERPTLLEKYISAGKDFNEDLMGKSKVYNDFLYGDSRN